MKKATDEGVKASFFMAIIAGGPLLVYAMFADPDVDMEYGLLGLVAFFSALAMGFYSRFEEVTRKNERLERQIKDLTDKYEK